MAGKSEPPTNHNAIKHWAGQRGAPPATVCGKLPEAEPARLPRFDFPRYTRKKISAEPFLRKFDDSYPAFLYQEKTRTGKISSLNKFADAGSAVKKAKPVWHLKQKRQPGK